MAELPFGTQKRVELARALASEPKLLLLDEPAGGLNHEEVDALRGEIQAIRDGRGVTVLLVEHHMNLVMRVSDQVVALDFGRKIADGPPGDGAAANPDVIRAYLGERPDGGAAGDARVSACYGPIQVLHGLDISVAEGGITTLLGANGAGKTTLLRAICAMIRERRRDPFWRRRASMQRRPKTSCGSASPMCRTGAAPSSISPSRRICGSAPIRARTARRRQTTSSASSAISRA